MAREEVMEAKEEGNKAFKAGDWSKAAQLYADALETVADTGLSDTKLQATLHSNRAAALLKAGDAAEAAMSCEAALALSFDDKPLRLKLHLRAGAALEKTGRATGAVAAYKAALVLDSNSTEAKAGIERAGPAAAAAAATAATTTTTATAPAAESPAAGPVVPPNVLKAKEAGNAAFKLGQFGDAVDHYSKALSLVKGSSMPAVEVMLLSNRAMAALKDGIPRRCVSDCDAALKIEPHNAKALLRRASAYEQLEKYTKAAGDYNHVCKQYPGHPQARKGFDRACRVARQLDPSWRPHMLPKLDVAVVAVQQQPQQQQQVRPSTVTTTSAAANSGSDKSASTSSVLPHTSAAAAAAVGADSPPPTPPAVGAVLELYGLSREDLNGKHADFCGVMTDSKGTIRWTVGVHGGSQMNIKPANLRKPTTAIATATATPTTTTTTTAAAPTAAPAAAAATNSVFVDNDKPVLSVPTAATESAVKPKATERSESTKDDAPSAKTVTPASPSIVPTKAHPKTHAAAAKPAVVDSDKGSYASLDRDQLVARLKAAELRVKALEKEARNEQAYMKVVVARAMEKCPEILARP